MPRNRLRTGKVELIKIAAPSPMAHCSGTTSTAKVAVRQKAFMNSPLSNRRR